MTSSRLPRRCPAALGQRRQDFPEGRQVGGFLPEVEQVGLVRAERRSSTQSEATTRRKLEFIASIAEARTQPLAVQPTRTILSTPLAIRTPARGVPKKAEALVLRITSLPGADAA